MSDTLTKDEIKALAPEPEKRNTWKLLKLHPENRKARNVAIRLNSLGCLFFFIYHTLGRRRLRNLHWHMCKELETADLHLLYEIPMAHFKTTVGTEGFPMWRSLHFSPLDEEYMRQMNYSDEWIRWMKQAHDINSRILITHEIDDNAIKFGRLVDGHYLSNPIFREVFPELIPNNACVWNDHSKYQPRTIPQAEGTFEFRGAGCALQSMHFSLIINDDSVGREAQQNFLRGDGQIIEGIYNWWKITTTRFDSASFTKTGIGPQLVIGNRWFHSDLNGKIRANHKEFKVLRHSAEGGCCPLHPAGQPIFPEEYTMERLAKLKDTLKSYMYSHYYLNLAVLPEECIFKPEWIGKFTFKSSAPELDLQDPRNVLLIEHGVKDGMAKEDTFAQAMHIRIIVDLNHAKKFSRCRHVIAVIGLDSETDNFYLLDCWAEAAPYSKLLDKLYHFAQKWNQKDVWVEEVGAQNLLRLPIQMRNETDKWPIYVNELPYDNSKNAKQNRIESMEPIYHNRQWWVHETDNLFMGEYETYPANDTVDILDTVGYAPKLFQGIRRKQVKVFLDEQREAFVNRNCGPTGY